MSEVRYNIGKQGRFGHFESNDNRRSIAADNSQILKKGSIVPDSSTSQHIENLFKKYLGSPTKRSGKEPTNLFQNNKVSSPRNQDLNQTALGKSYTFDRV